MKKAKKYIYPFIFSVGLFFSYMILEIVLEIALPSRDYNGFAYSGIVSIIWILFIVPVFCFEYCKLICQEKYKFLFGFYNPLVIALCHTVPFFNPTVSGSDVDIIILIVIVIFGWAAIWTFVPLVTRFKSAEKQDDDNSNEAQKLSGNIMQKLKKYIYPVVFVVISFACLLATGFICNIFLNGDWSALAVLFIAVVILGSIILPIYCVKYSKIIQGERFKVLFAIYNAFVIVGSYMLPLIKFEETYGYGIIIFIWALFWSVLRLNFHTNTCENEEKLSKEKADITNLLLQNKKKNIVAICITCLYIITLAREPMAWQLYIISYIFIFTLPLLSAFLFLVFLFSKNVDYSLKSWLLPFALAGELISRLFSIYSSISSMDMQLKHNPMYPVNFAFSCLMAIIIAIMFTGTLFNFKYIKLLKYGALGYVILSIGLLIFNLINVGGIAYHQIDMNGTLAINTSLVIESLICASYFIGIFILTTNKKKTDLDIY